MSLVQFASVSLVRRFADQLVQKSVEFHGTIHDLEALQHVDASDASLSSKSAAVNAENETIWLHRDPQATVHMVAGTGGASFTKNNNVAKPPAWSEAVFFRYGYARVIASSPNVMCVEWVDNIEGKVHDRMCIRQTDPNAPWNLSDDNDGLSNAAVAGVVVSAVLVLGAAIVGLLYWRKRTMQENVHEQRFEQQKLLTSV